MPSWSSCFGRPDPDATTREPDAFVVLRESSANQDEVLWKDRSKIFKQLQTLFSGNVCVFKAKDVVASHPECKLSPAWVPCTGRRALTTKVEGFSSWVDDFPGGWEYGKIYVANPLKDTHDRADNKVPCFLMTECDRVQEDWHTAMFHCALSLAGAKAATMRITSEDGTETTKAVVTQQDEKNKSRHGRLSLPRLAARRTKEPHAYVLDLRALEDYVRLFGAKMISSLGQHSLTEFVETTKRTGRLGEPGDGGDVGEPDLSWAMDDSFLEMLQVDLGETELKAGFSGVVDVAHKVPLAARFKKHAVRNIHVEVWFHDNEAIKKALLEKLVEMESFMREQKLFQQIVGKLTTIVKRRPPRSSEDEGSTIARHVVRVVVLGGRGVGKSAFLYTLKLIEQLVGPPGRVLRDSELGDLLAKPDGLVFNDEGDIVDIGTTETREYTVMRRTFEAGHPEQARLVVCDTPGMSMNRDDHSRERQLMMDDTWDYVASHIPTGEVEKISPLLVFRADKVAEAYQGLSTNQPKKAAELLGYLDSLLLGLETRGATLEDIVVVGTHADKVDDDVEWKKFIANVSERCNESVSSFLVHNFGEQEFSRNDQNLEKMWEALRSSFICDPSNPLKTRATPVQEATLCVLDKVREREANAMAQARGNFGEFGLVDLFNQQSMLLRG